jgi:predicted acetyltransferase
MIIKKLEGKERFEAYKLAMFCFHHRVEDIDEKREKMEADTREAWGAFDENENKTLMAHIINYHYDFLVDGVPVKTGGIGAVSTLPEYRESGAVRAIFNELLPQAYGNGEVLSSLYPFNHKFYRKFGYEVIPFETEYNLRPGVFSNYRSLVPDDEKCAVHKWNKGESVKDFLDVYNSFASNFNLSAVRTEEKMLEHLKIEKEFIDRKFSYLFTLKEKPVAYLIFKDEYNPEAAHMKVEETAWTCRAGFNAILNFLSRFSSDYGSITLRLPKGIDLLKIITTSDAYSIENKVCQHFMLRVVNAKKLLEIIKKPENCNFTIKIEDELIKENNLALRVLSDHIEVLNSADSSQTSGNQTNDCKFDLELNVRALAQLAIGCTNLDEALLRPDVKMNGNEEMLRKCFFEKKIFVSESF